LSYVKGESGFFSLFLKKFFAKKRLSVLDASDAEVTFFIHENSRVSSLVGKLARRAGRACLAGAS
jgi:hypothetical protein